VSPQPSNNAATDRQVIHDMAYAAAVRMHSSGATNMMMENQANHFKHQQLAKQHTNNMVKTDQATPLEVHACTG
jgi:hypothetical protein